MGTGVSTVRIVTQYERTMTEELFDLSDGYRSDAESGPASLGREHGLFHRRSTQNSAIAVRDRNACQVCDWISGAASVGGTPAGGSPRCSLSLTCSRASTKATSGYGRGAHLSAAWQLNCGPNMRYQLIGRHFEQGMTRTMVRKSCDVNGVFHRTSLAHIRETSALDVRSARKLTVVGTPRESGR